MTICSPYDQPHRRKYKNVISNIKVQDPLDVKLGGHMIILFLCHFHRTHFFKKGKKKKEQDTLYMTGLRKTLNDNLDRSIISWSVSPLTEGENPQEGYRIQKHKDMYMY